MNRLALLTGMIVTSIISLTLSSPVHAAGGDYRR